MSLSIPIPHHLVKDERALAQLVSEIVRRAIDGSVNPAQLNVGIRITGNDLTIATAGNGVILSNRAGTHTYRLLMENDGTISADKIT